MTELDSLVIEQQKDDGSRYVTAPTGFSTTEMQTNWDFTNIARNYLAEKEMPCRVSWGKPAQLCQALIDRECPVCGRRLGKGDDDFQGSYNGEMAFWCPNRTVDAIKYKQMYCSRPPSLLVLTIHQSHVQLAVSEFSW